MSKFFKALEKAEREARKTAGNDSPPPAANTDEAEAGTPPASARSATATTAPPPRPEAKLPLPAELELPLRLEPELPRSEPEPTFRAEPATAAAAPVAPLRPEAAAPVVSAWPPPQGAPRTVVRVERAARKPSKNWTKPARLRNGAPVLVVDREPSSVATEAYRALRVNIEFMLQGQKCRNIVITSPSQGEGKSTTAANLALVAAQAGWRVCLVEADLRRPVLHTAFGLPNRAGLVKALAEELPLSTVALPTDFPGLSVVVAGDYDPGQTDLFSSSRIQQVQQDIASHFDLVLWDTPPVMLVADALNLVAQCDGVILVVRSGAIPSGVLRRAGRQIAQVKGKILGVLLNNIDLRRNDEEFARYYHAYHQGHGDKQP